MKPSKNPLIQSAGEVMLNALTAAHPKIKTSETLEVLGGLMAATFSTVIVRDIGIDAAQSEWDRFAAHIRIQIATISERSRS